jgi:hypothetical protein
MKKLMRQKSKMVSSLILSTMFLLTFYGCNRNREDLFFRGDQSVAYWDVLSANKQPTGYGYSFERNGHLEFYALYKGKERHKYDGDDLVPLNDQWKWDGDTLVLEGLQRLIFPIFPDTLLMVNPITGDLFWLAYSSDQGKGKESDW